MKYWRQIATDDVLAALALIAVSLAALLYIAGLPARAAMFPRLAAGALLGLSVLYLVREILRRSAEPRAAFFHHAPRFVVALALVVAYALTFPQVGYFTTTIVFIPVFAAAIGMRRYLLTLAATVGASAVIYLVFVVFLNRRLPPERLLDLLTGV